jgi:hypothetical protein
MDNWLSNLAHVSTELQSMENITKPAIYAYDPKKRVFVDRPKNYNWNMSWYFYQSYAANNILSGTKAIRSDAVKVLREARVLLKNPNVDSDTCNLISNTVQNLYIHVMEAHKGAHEIVSRGNLQKSYRENLDQDVETCFNSLDVDFAKTFDKIKAKQNKIENASPEVESVEHQEVNYHPFPHDKLDSRRMGVNVDYLMHLRNAIAFVDDHVEDWFKELNASGGKELKKQYDFGLDSQKKWTIVLRDNGGVYIHSHDRIVKDGGAFKIDKLAYRSDFDDPLAKLSIKPKQSSDLEKIEKEIKYLTRLKGIPHVVQLEHVVQKKRPVDKLQKTTLYFKYLKNQRLIDCLPQLTDEQTKQIILDILVGLKGVHNKGKIVHLDLKSDNILIDENMRAYVSDFGLSDDIGTSLNNVKGSPESYSPELWDLRLRVISRLAIGPPQDVWAAGVIIYKLLMKKMPPWLTNVHQLEDIPMRIYDKNNNFFPEPSDPALHICWEMCQIDSDKRITIEQAYKKFSDLFK